MLFVAVNSITTSNLRHTSFVDESKEAGIECGLLQNRDDQTDQGSKIALVRSSLFKRESRLLTNSVN